MKLFLSIFILAAAALEGPSVHERDSLLMMFWNLENLFDWRRDSTLDNPSEAEFTPRGKRHWTRKKFGIKREAIAKTIFWVAEGWGRMPDIIGVAEVENAFVLKELLKETALRKSGYGIVHYDSPDPRGIDVALLYRKSTLEILDSKPLRIENRNKDGPELKTRDILLVGFKRPSGDSLAVLVNHHPSKYGANSEWRRKAALQRLSEATDSLISTGWRDIVAMGDFNDTPESTEEYSRKMVNLALQLAKKGEGTIKYSGKWEMIDMFFVSKSIRAKNPEAAMRVERVPFLSVRDNTHSGEKPFRAYLGPGYTGGVSDHCPITLLIP